MVLVVDGEATQIIALLSPFDWLRLDSCDFAVWRSPVPRLDTSRLPLRDALRQALHHGRLADAGRAHEAAVVPDVRHARETLSSLMQVE